MLFLSQVLGQEHIKTSLKATLAESCTHAIYRSRSGTLVTALAYAQYLLCANTGGENNGLNDSCNIKFQKYSHPDLHFIYPTVTTDAVKPSPKALTSLQIGDSLLLKIHTEAFFEWYDVLGVQNKQGEIRVDDAQEILKNIA
jgi:DNA polymerase-3 subunit delta'